MKFFYYLFWFFFFFTILMPLISRVFLFAMSFLIKRLAKRSMQSNQGGFKTYQYSFGGNKANYSNHNSESSEYSEKVKTDKKYGEVFEAEFKELN